MTRISGHPSDDALEESLLGHLSERELDQLADHLAGCFACQIRLEERRHFIAAMKAALADHPPSAPLHWDERVLMAGLAWRPLPWILLALLVGTAILGWLLLPVPSERVPDPPWLP